jgi:hypothetical protein
MMAAIRRNQLSNAAQIVTKLWQMWQCFDPKVINIKSSGEYPQGILGIVDHGTATAFQAGRQEDHLPSRSSQQNRYTLEASEPAGAWAFGRPLGG